MGSISENRENGRSSTAEEEAVSSLATTLSIGAVLPMVLKTVLELDLLELIQKSGLNASASELAVQLPTNNPNAANMIDRMLRFLSAQSILVCSFNTLPDGGVERRYALGPVCKVLTKVEGEVSIAPLLLLNHDKVSMESWYHLKDAILDGGIPFDRAHGMNSFEYLARDPSYNKIFNKAMSVESLRIAKKIVESYKGFEGLGSLVDVGGGNGTILGMITSKYPSIKGFNFDMPHVVRDAPSYPGVKHVPGDMFLSLPNADAIFMKWICHDWSDAQCLKLLKNCYDALPSNGKVIIAEFVVPDEPDSGPEFTRVTKADVIMMAYNPGGKERTFKEFQALAQQAGFTEIHKVCQAFPLWIMELHK